MKSAITGGKEGRRVFKVRDEHLSDNSVDLVDHWMDHQSEQKSEPGAVVRLWDISDSSRRRTFDEQIYK